MEPVVDVRNLRRVYPLAEEPVIALAGIDLTIDPGEFVAVMGPSGSGKSTFMHIVGLLDRPTSGEYRFAGHDLGSLLQAFAECDAEKDRPSVVFAYTIKGWGLPMAGNPRNHSALLSTAQID